MNINSISNLNFNARMLKNVQVYDKNNNNIIVKDINIEDIDTSKPDNESPDIVYKNGDWENFADYRSDINVAKLACDALKKVKSEDAFIDMYKMEESCSIENKGTSNKKTKTCFTFQIEGTDKPNTVHYCYLRY